VREWDDAPPEQEAEHDGRAEHRVPERGEVGLVGCEAREQVYGDVAELDHGEAALTDRADRELRACKVCVSLERAGVEGRGEGTERRTQLETTTSRGGRWCRMRRWRYRTMTAAARSMPMPPHKYDAMKSVRQ